MKKIISILVCVCVLLSAMVFTASAADATNTLTIKEAIELGLSKEHNTYTEDKYYVTGVITEVYNTTYGNMRLTDDEGNILTIYGTYSADGELRYDKMDVKPVAGDTVTIYGIVGQYNDTPQIKNGWIVEHASGESGDVTPPAEDEAPTATLVESPVAETAYKFGMIQGNVSETDVYYLAGGMDGYYLATTADAVAAIDVYLEETDGGYYLYTMVDGVKTYINMVVSGTHVNGAYEATASTVYTYDADAQTVIATVNDEPYWFGTRNDKSYTTVGPCKTSYNGFYSKFYTVSSTEGGEVTPPVEDDEPVELPTPDETNTLTVKEAIDLGLTKEHNTYTEDKYYVTGVISEVYNTQYGNMKLADEEGNILTIYGTYSADGELRYDAMEVQPVAGDTVTIYGIVGQYNDTPQIKNGWIVDHVLGEGGTNAPADEDKPADKPEEKPVMGFGVIANPVANTAYKFGMVQGNLNKTLYLTGEMDGFYMATTDNKDQAADVYLEATTGGHYIYAMVNGAKKYLGIVEAKGTDGKTHINAVFTDTASSVFTYNADLKTYVTKVGDKEYGFGTRNDREYTTISPSSTEYTDNFFCQFYGMTVVNADGSPIAPSTSDNVGAAVAMAIAAGAVILYTSKKR